MHAFHRLRLAVGLIALSALVVLAAGPAAAAPTDKKPNDRFLVFTIHETNEVPLEACGFPLLVHVDGFIKVRFPANTRQGVLEVDSVHLKLLWENPANGKTSDVTVAEIDRIIDNGDGTVTVLITGLSGRDTIPGAGRITGDIGRLALTFDAATGGFLGLEVLAGPHSFGPFPALCQYLA